MTMLAPRSFAPGATAQKQHHHGSQGGSNPPKAVIARPQRYNPNVTLSAHNLLVRTSPQQHDGARRAWQLHARHPELVAASTSQHIEVKDRPNIEADEHYRRADFSEVFQWEARQAFARCIAGGEPRMRLAEAALHVVAEDDAIASHSTVPFPVQAYLERITRLVDELQALLLTHMTHIEATRNSSPREGEPLGQGGRDSSPGPGEGAPGHVFGGGCAEGGGGGAADGAGSVDVTSAEEVAGAFRHVERYLFEGRGFRAPPYGRSKLPKRAVVDHPGVWEDPRLGYLNEVLIRRLGHPSTLGLLLAEVCRQLLARGALPCAAAVDTRGFQELPRAVPLPELTRERLMAAADGQAEDGAEASSSQGVALNTCTSEVLAEMLRHLKRSYWPFAWDSGVDAYAEGGSGSLGGFRSAAKLAVGEEMSAALEAVSKVAAWRLDRGIWTSPGAGDIRRARTACERLVMLVGERCPEERRDLAVLLVHAGELGAARAELRAYLAAVSAPSARPTTSGAAAAAPNGGGPGAPGTPDDAGGFGAGSLDLVLCRRLMALLAGLGDSVREPREVVGVEAALVAPPPWESEAAAGAGARHRPLTW